MLQKIFIITVTQIQQFVNSRIRRRHTFVLSVFINLEYSQMDLKIIFLCCASGVFTHPECRSCYAPDNIDEDGGSMAVYPTELGQIVQPASTAPGDMRDGV